MCTGGWGHGLQASGHCKPGAERWRIESTSGVLASYPLTPDTFHTFILLGMMGRGEGERRRERGREQNEQAFPG